MRKRSLHQERRHGIPKALEPFIDALAELLVTAVLRDFEDRRRMTITELFRAAGLQPEGPVQWKTPIPDSRPGVYVVALVGDKTNKTPVISVDSLSPAERKRWVAGQPVLYIGRATRSLRNRMAQFYRHKHGAKAPLRGGQAVIPFECERWGVLGDAR